MDDLEDFQFDQSMRLISVESFGPGKNKIAVVSFEGVEQLSGLSHFRLEIVSQGRALKPAEILGQNLGIALRVREHTRRFNGLVSRFEVLRTSVLGLYLHMVELRPPAWLMTLNKRCRIFHDQKAVDVVGAVVSEAGVSYQPASAGEQREYWVQYCESDFNFVSRLLEEVGLFYRFDHASDDCKLILGDGSGGYVTPDEEMLVARENMTSWEPYYRVGASAYRHAVWDFKTVATVEATVNGLPKAQPRGLDPRQVYEFPGRHETAEEASSLAKVRMEAEEATLVGATGSSIDTRVSTGARYKVAGHTLLLPDSSEARDFVAVRVEHRARDHSQLPFDGETDYVNHFDCIPADFSFRPQRVTPRPVIHGTQVALVTGSPDDFGRAQVKFPWDEEDSSRWVRVGQNWAYNKMGVQFFPRANSEVLVEFEDGDPDHPIVIGMLYNGKNKPPFEVPANKTQSGIRGANWDSAGAAGVSNELRFEDKEGEEEIYLHAQKDFRRVVHHADSLTVETGDRSIQIQQGNLSQTLNQGNASYKLALGNYDIDVQAGEASTKAMQSITLSVGGSSIKIDQMGVTIKGMMIKIEGEVQVDVNAVLTTVKADAMLTLKGGLTMIN